MPSFIGSSTNGEEELVPPLPLTQPETTPKLSPPALTPGTSPLKRPDISVVIITTTLLLPANGAVDLVLLPPPILLKIAPEVIVVPHCGRDNALHHEYFFHVYS
jgi:hypothetical protein